MADETAKKPSLGLDIQVGEGTTTAASFSGKDTDISSSNSSGAGVDFEADGTVRRTGLGGNDTEEDLKDIEGELDGSLSDDADTNGDPDDTRGDDTGSDADADTESANEGDPYDPDNEETVEAFDKKYMSEDGSEINFDAFTGELQENVAKGVWDINKSSREYLKDRFGINNSMVDAYLEGFKARSEANDSSFYELVGGQDAYTAMLSWGSENYSKEQKAKFNTALKAGGEDAREQLELLISRANKAGVGVQKKDPATTKKIGLQKRRAAPQRDATSSAGGGERSVVEGFSSPEEHRAEMLKANASKDPAKIEEVRKRLRASKWFKA